MPAVDPFRLRAALDGLEAVFADPEALQRRCLDLFEFYASRVRAGSSVSRPGSLPSLDVPASVRREVELRLEARARRDPEAAARAADRLWDSPLLEMRLLAIGLLAAQPVERIIGRAEAWCRTEDDPRVLDRLADGPLRRLAQERADWFWSTLAGWLAGDAARPAGMAWSSLKAAISDLAPQDLPMVFDLLRRSPVPDGGQARRARLGALERLARRSAAETARFLVDELDLERPGTRIVVRQLIPAFPPREQQALRAALERRERA